MKHAIVLGLLLLLAPGAGAEKYTLTPLSEAEQEEFDAAAAMVDKFKLFDGCRPMELMVSLYPDVNEIGLTEESLRIIAESKLRAAHLYAPDAVSIFHVYVETLDGASASFIAGAKYYKQVLDLGSNVSNLATMWESGDLGTHDDDKGFILTAVAEHVDEFLADYLRVNDPLCSGTGRRYAGE